MNLHLIACFCFGVVPLASFVCVCMMLSIWLALGKSHLFVRMPLFLVGTLPLGMLIGVIETKPFMVTCTWIFGLLMLAASLTRSHILLQLLAFLVGTLTLTGSFIAAGLEILDSGWMVRIALATSFVAGAVAILRLFGFELVNLTEGVSNLDIEQGTGRDLDQWIITLDAANGASLNHASLMAFLRPFGFSYSWQRVVTVAYERTLGRRTLASELAPRPFASQGVIADSERAAAISTQPRFTIRQIMLITFCVASLLGFVRTFTRFQPTLADVEYGIPLAIAAVLIVHLTLFASLSLRNVRAKMALAAVTEVIIAFALPHTVGLRPSTFNYFMLLSGTLAYAGILMAAMMLVRDRSYRLVRLTRSVA